MNNCLEFEISKLVSVQSYIQISSAKKFVSSNTFLNFNKKIFMYRAKNLINKNKFYSLFRKRSENKILLLKTEFVQSRVFKNTVNQQQNNIKLSKYNK